MSLIREDGIKHCKSQDSGLDTTLNADDEDEIIEINNGYGDQLEEINSDTKNEEQALDDSNTENPHKQNLKISETKLEDYEISNKDCDKKDKEVENMPGIKTASADSPMAPLVMENIGKGTEKDIEAKQNGELKQYKEPTVDKNNNTKEGKVKSNFNKTTFYLTEEELEDSTEESDTKADEDPADGTKPKPKGLSKLRKIPSTALGKLFVSQQWRRLVEKSGESNVVNTKIRKRSIFFLLDIFTTVIEIKWRYVFLMFFGAFNVTWVVFAFVWWGIAAHHQDGVEVLVNGTAVEKNSCVDGVTDFVTAFLFSLETMHTIGYGTRAMTDECPIAVFILILQACFGVFMQSIVTAIVLAKIARPKWRGNTIMFSRYAVVNNLIKNKPCLQFRVGDMRNRSHLVNATIRAIWVEKEYNSNNEAMPLNQHHFQVEPETGSDLLLMTWPITILHYIDEESPLYGLDQSDIIGGKFEIIAILEGTIEPTGMSAQVRTSYIPSEIFWNQKLTPLMSYKNKDGKYMIDHTKFHGVEEITKEEQS